MCPLKNINTYYSTIAAKNVSVVQSQTMFCIFCYIVSPFGVNRYNSISLSYKTNVIYYM